MLEACARDISLKNDGNSKYRDNGDSAGNVALPRRHLGRGMMWGTLPREKERCWDGGSALEPIPKWKAYRELYFEIGSR